MLQQWYEETCLFSILVSRCECADSERYIFFSPRCSAPVPRTNQKLFVNVGGCSWIYPCLKSLIYGICASTILILFCWKCQIMEIKSKNGLRNACFLVRLLFARLKGKYLWSTPELDYSCLDSQESKDPEIWMICKTHSGKGGLKYWSQNPMNCMLESCFHAQMN